MHLLRKTGEKPSLLKFLLYSLSSLLLVTLVTSNAQAIPSQMLNIKVTYYATPSWVVHNGFGFSLFTSPSNMWATPEMWQNMEELASGEAAFTPGRAVYEVSASVADLSNLYMQMAGGFLGCPPGDCENPYYQSIFVAEPPTGWVSDQEAWMYGPPWISLANVGSGLALSGDLEIINGYDAGTYRPWVVGTWEVTPVPEPSSLLLIGAGLSGLGLATYRRRRQSLV